MELKNLFFRKTADDSIELNNVDFACVNGVGFCGFILVNPKLF